MNHKRSQELYRQAVEMMPGGVNSPVRGFRAVGGTPVFFESGSGCRMRDVDGNEYIDFVGSWGPLILGHAHPVIVEAIRSAAGRGTTFGASTPLELDLAMTIRQAFPSMEKLRLVSSGTEAVMSALRVARGYTGRNHVIKMEGCYHGHSDSLLTAAGSGVATFDLPGSAGVPEYYTRHTITVSYNDLEALERLPKEILADTAAVLVEPVAANMGLVLPEPGYLQGLRRFTTEHGILLIFDEVITGFRLCFGGAQKVYDVRPDLTCLGKIVGGGMPLAVYGGRADIMQKVAPEGPVYQAGTLSGNPVAVSAGLATLQILKNQDYELLEKTTEEFLSSVSLPPGVTLVHLGSMFTFFFQPTAPKNYQQVRQSDTARYGRFFWNALERSVYLTPSQFETNFVSFAHTRDDLKEAAQKIQDAFSRLYL